jgi:hypothetical protein
MNTGKKSRGRPPKKKGESKIENLPKELEVKYITTIWASDWYGKYSDLIHKSIYKALDPKELTEKVYETKVPGLLYITAHNNNQTYAQLYAFTPRAIERVKNLEKFISNYSHDFLGNFEFYLEQSLDNIIREYPTVNIPHFKDIEISKLKKKK